MARNIVRNINFAPSFIADQEPLRRTASSDELARLILDDYRAYLKTLSQTRNDDDTGAEQEEPVQQEMSLPVSAQDAKIQIDNTLNIYSMFARTNFGVSKPARLPWVSKIASVRAFNQYLNADAIPRIKDSRGISVLPLYVHSITRRYDQMQTSVSIAGKAGDLSCKDMVLFDILLNHARETLIGMDQATAQAVITNPQAMFSISLMELSDLWSGGDSGKKSPRFTLQALLRIYHSEISVSVSDLEYRVIDDERITNETTRAKRLLMLTALETETERAGKTHRTIIRYRLDQHVLKGLLNDRKTRALNYENVVRSLTGGGIAWYKEMRNVLHMSYMQARDRFNQLDEHERLVAGRYGHAHVMIQEYTLKDLLVVSGMMKQGDSPEMTERAYATTLGNIAEAARVISLEGEFQPVVLSRPGVKKALGKSAKVPLDEPVVSIAACTRYLKHQDRFC